MGLFGGPSDGVPEYVDQVTAGLCAYAGEHGLQAFGGVRSDILHSHHCAAAAGRVMTA
ncbi:MAG: hypothetical protein M3Y48_16030 [Actinomycetota bacterium]|nr:hypothetical protein [Actinomycetota bacterium]